MGVKSLVKQVLTEQQNKTYKKCLASQTRTYEEWIREVEKSQWMQWQEKGVRVAAADAGEIPACNVSADDDRIFYYYLRPGVKMAQGALERITWYFEKHPEVQLVYGDEDVLDASGKRACPWFKPDWSPDLLNTYFYFGSLVAVRKELWQQVQNESEYLNRIYECVMLAGGFEKGCKAIAHIPEILCHCVSKEQMDEWLAVTYGQNYGEKHLQAQKNNKVSEPISVIIPSKDNPELLEKCIRAVSKVAEGIAYEIIIVDNGSRDENQFEIQEMKKRWEADFGNDGLMEDGFCTGKILYRYEPMEFNFSHMCNLGAEQANGKLLLFLNDDVELCVAGTLEKMAEVACRDYNGAVGLKLYYPDSVRIQHAGITNLPIGPVHKLQFLEDNTSYYFDSNKGLRNVLAVTAACLMVSRDKFAEAGGFSEDLRVAFNDVDLCFTLYDLGYHNVCRNDVYAYHHESLSRGNDESSEKWLRLQAERRVLYERHPALEGVDPYYGAGLARKGLDTRIRPAYETAGNRLQKFSPTPWKGKESDYRKDNCLLVRLEQCRNHYLQGYAVVLGDNNACYEFELLLKHKESGQIYSVVLQGQYRPDLVENMPDQENVGLCGFEAEQARFPAGEYEIRMTARNRVTGLKLLNDTDRVMTVSYKDS